MAPAAIRIWSFITLSVLVVLLVHSSRGLSVTQPLCTLCNCSYRGMLDCDNRNITEIPALTGTKTNLTIVFFDNNYIKRIRQFPKLREVRELVLTRNEITDIEDSAFKNLVNMIVLDLSYNRLTSEKLLPRVFRGTASADLYEPLPNLLILNIAYNNLHTLNPKLFEHLPHLEHLNLRGNPLNVIGNGVFSAINGVPLLKELNLAHTRLKSLPENCFHETKFLKTLDLSHNLFTVPPQALENSHNLEWLSLDGNLFVRIRQFPKLPFLQTFHLNKMPELVSIGNRSLSNLPSLKEFYCSDNPKLVKIDKDAFSYVNESLGEGEMWPPLEKLILRNNALRYIDSHVLGRWDYLSSVDLQYNPWLCDCENQWLVSTLVPLIEEVQPESLREFKCGLPLEMENTTFIDMYNRDYEMRCLDAYNHKPEKDGKLLVQILIFVIILAPFIMGAVLYYKRCAKINQLQRLNYFIRYSHLNLIPVKSTDY